MRIDELKKSVAALLVALFVGLSLPCDARAQAQAVRPDCDAEINTIQNNYNDALKVRNQAITAQIITRNDSALALTCFDQALSMTSMAGKIFSDEFDFAAFSPTTLMNGFMNKAAGTLAGDYMIIDIAALANPLNWPTLITALIPPWSIANVNTIITMMGGRGGITIPAGVPVLGGLKLPIPGIGEMLVLQINNAVNGSLDSMLSNMAGSLMNQLAGTLTSFLTSAMNNMMTAIFAAIFGSSIGTAFTSFFNSFGITVTLDFSSFLTPIINAIVAAVIPGGSSGKMLNCSAMGMLWNGVNMNAATGASGAALPNGGVVGAGVAPDVPYITSAQLLAAGAVVPPAGAVVPPGVIGGSSMARKLTNVANRGILNAANAGVGRLATTARGTPAAPPSQQAVPALPPNPTTTAVINAM